MINIFPKGSAAETLGTTATGEATIENQILSLKLGELLSFLCVFCPGFVCLWCPVLRTAVILGSVFSTKNMDAVSILHRGFTLNSLRNIYIYIY